MRKLLNTIICGIAIGGTIVGGLAVVLAFCYGVAAYPGITIAVVAIYLLIKK